jgi:hypothetical protein
VAFNIRKIRKTLCAGIGAMIGGMINAGKENSQKFYRSIRFDFLYGEVRNNITISGASKEPSIERKNCRSIASEEITVTKKVRIPPMGKEGAYLAHRLF